MPPHPADLLVPGPRLRLGPVRRVFPTTSGTRVELRDSDEAGLVIVKRPAPGATPVVHRALVAQARQLRVLELTCPQAPCARVLECGPDRVVLRYVPGETLRDSTDLDDGARLRLLGTAVVTVFELALWSPNGGGARPSGAGFVAAERAGRSADSGGSPPSGSGFVGAELARRLDRLEHAVARLPGGRRLAEAMARCDGGRLVDALRSGAGPTVSAAGTAVSPARLGLGVHGDLTPQNIVHSPDSGRLTLIDVRGLVRWSAGLPWWDPVFDLAAAVVFHGAIDPMTRALAEGRRVEVAELGRRLGAVRDALVADVSASAGGRRWAAQDPRWRDRLVLAILARLLGNVPVQIEHGGPDGVRRAAVGYALTAWWYERLTAPP